MSSATSATPATRKSWTDAAVKALKHGATDQRFGMGEGLTLVVSKVGKFTAGTKSWITRYKVAGRTKEPTLGIYAPGQPGHMSLAAARHARSEVRQAVKEGRDPLVERLQAREERQTDNQNTVEVLVRAWHQRHQGKWMPIYARQMLQRFEKDVFPDIGALPIKAVTRARLKALLHNVMQRSPFQADHVRQHLALAFNDFLDSELIDANPAARLHAETETPDKQRQPAVTKIEAAREVLAKFEAGPASDTMKLLHRFQLLTGVRPSEARCAMWSELEEPGLWQIPKERMKGRRGRKSAHAVFLSRQAQEVIEAARALRRPRAVYVFPRLHADEPLGRSSLAEAMKRCLGARLHVAHGWRSTMTTALKVRGHSKANVEMMLAHTESGGSHRNYDRSEVLDYESTLRPIWQEWADLIAPAGAVVVPLAA